MTKLIVAFRSSATALKNDITAILIEFLLFLACIYIKYEYLTMATRPKRVVSRRTVNVEL